MPFREISQLFMSDGANDVKWRFASLPSSQGAFKAGKKINADVQAALAESDVRARFETFAFESLAWSPADIERQAALKARTYAEPVQRKSISLE